MRGKRTPDKLRAKAVGLALVAGVPDAAKAMGVSERNIRRWKQDPEMAELVQRTKEAVTEEWWGVIQKGVRRVADLLDAAEDVQKVATATAIVTDKMLLIRGEATSRTESTLLQGRSDHEQRLLADIINRELEGRADAHAPGDQEPDPMAQPATAEPSSAGG